MDQYLVFLKLNIFRVFNFNLRGILCFDRNILESSVFRKIGTACSPFIDLNIGEPDIEKIRNARFRGATLYSMISQCGGFSVISSGSTG